MYRSLYCSKDVEEIIRRNHKFEDIRPLPKPKLISIEEALHLLKFNKAVCYVKPGRKRKQPSFERSFRKLSFKDGKLIEKILIYHVNVSTDTL